jgi:glycosyltransferase involved in cell wall biosynthesis
VIPRVVHVASGREWRGGQRQVWLLAQELQRRGIDQVVVTSLGSELARRLRGSQVPVQPASWQAGLDPRVIPVILKALARPTLLHAHDGHAATLAGLCSRMTGTPFVITRRVTFPLRRRYFWRRACRIITISSAVRDALLSDGLEPSRLVLIPSAVDPAATTAGAVDLRTRLGLPQSGQLAITLGSLTPEKDHFTLVAAASQLVRDLPNLHWIIVGEGPLQQPLRGAIERAGLGPRVHLVGPLEDPHRALAGADVFVLSSTQEGLGSSILAAMALGVPIVATRVGGVVDLLGSGGGLMVEAARPDQLADAIRQVLGDENLRSRLVARARDELGRFSLSGMAEQVLSVYRSCAHSLDGS